MSKDVEIKADDQVKDWSVIRTVATIFVVVILCLIVSEIMVQITMGESRYHHVLARRIICASSIKQLGLALHLYASENDDRLPSENWSDALKSYLDDNHEIFRCIGSEHLKGESSYAFNVEAAGKKLSELPKKMVLLFETDGLREGKRWNQIGGPELLTFKNHLGKGANIGFVDGSVVYKRWADISGLRWCVEGDELFPAGVLEKIDEENLEVKSKKRKMLACKIPLAGVYIVAVGIGMIMFVSKRSIGGYGGFAFVLAILSGGVGAVNGSRAMMLYVYPLEKAHDWIIATGAIGATIFGVLIAYCYIGVLARRIKANDGKVAIMRDAILKGMLTGMICSTITHGMHWLLFEVKIDAMLAGLPYGIGAGVFLGLITGLYMKKKLCGVDHG